MQSLKFSDVQPGDELPAFTGEPVSRLALALYCGASGDHNPIHVDLDFARRAGMPDVFAHGMLSMAWLGRLLTGWVPQERIRQFAVRFVAITQLGDAVTCSGKVLDKDPASGTVRLEITTRNQAGEIKLSGEAVIALDN